MKLRTHRVHHMGASNRDLEPLPLSSTDVFEKSYVKSHSSFYHTNSQPAPHSYPARPDPLQGTHSQQQTLRWDPAAKKTGRETEWQLGKALARLDRSGQLNAEARQLVEEFSGKEVNMFKLGQLKRTFVKNNRKRRNLNGYFQNFATEGRLGVEALQRMVSEYGYDVTAEEAKLVLRLAGAKEDFLTQEQFVELMTKDNVLFRTLKLDGTFGQPKIHFPERIHLVFRNKAIQLKEAFRIYRMRGEQIDKQRFDYVMKKLDINDLVISKEEREDLFVKFSDQTDYFNAEKLFCAISEQEQTRSPTFPPRLSNFDDNLKATEEIQAKITGKSARFDFKRLSSLQYEHQLLKAREVYKQLTQIPNFCQLIFGQGDKLSRQAVREKVEAVLQKQGVNCSQEEYDCFVSSLDFNVNHHISSSQFNMFLNETPKQAEERHQRRLRALPPRLAPHSQTEYDVSAALESLKKVRGRKLDTEMRSLFKEFDKDKDGFVSREELKDRLGSLAVLEQWQIDNLTNYFEEGRGYVDFSTFAGKFAQGDREPENPTEAILKARSQSQWASTKRTIIRNNNTYTCNVPSKYSAWPERLKRTDFSLVQPPSKAGQFLGQEDRFQVQEKHRIGQQTKLERHRVYQNKLRKLAAWNELAQERAAQSQRKAQQRSQANDYILRLTKETYEQHCHPDRHL